MSRRKHQGDPDGSESTDSCDENPNFTPECSHIQKGVDLNAIRKVMSKGGLTATCELCKKMPDNDLQMNGDFEIDLSLWMCLKCGHQACGRQCNQHALVHYNTPHSDCHALCVNTEHWRVWCYECDNDVNVISKKKLLEAVEYIKKAVQQKSESNEQKQVPSTDSLAVVPYANTAAQTSANEDAAVTSRPRGLQNLGNTCFFNSVVQCLAQTPYLLDLLLETSKGGQHFCLPGGKIKDKEDSTDVPPLEGFLEKWKPLTSTLAETILEMHNNRREPFVPRMLLSRLVGRMPQFGGGDQHDSHELLRHLLEAVREEDLRRYQAVILEKLGLNKKTDPSTVEGDRKKVVKFYGQQASEMLLPTEQVFRGVLISTLKCENCNHTSLVEEYFLDLSLPIVEKTVPPILRRKADDGEESKTKHQIKKEKKAERKKKRQQCNKQNSMIIGAVSADQLPADNVDMNYSDSESDADVEDNLEGETMKDSESGYNTEKIDNSSPDSNEQLLGAEIRPNDSGLTSPSSGTVEDSLCSMDSNIKPLADDRPKSRLSFTKKASPDLKADLSKLHLHGNEEGDENENVDSDEEMELDDLSSWTDRMSAMYEGEDGECSVQSCLNQFTAAELMAGANKVSCEQCATRSGDSSKKIYTTAIKQFLIYNPPAVLILHLKRFQVYRFRSAKVSKFVKFPFILDLAPFCSKRSLDLPTMKDKTNVMYSLFGVVEHSGSIHGGHYVAYVKVRPKCPKDSCKWQFLPKNQQESLTNAVKDETDASAGKWYYISDSHVAEVTESKVLGAQAYLLFYERIL